MVFVSCSFKSDELDARDYISFIETKCAGTLTNVKTVNDISYKVMYLPIDYMLLKNENLENGKIDKEKYSKEYSANKNTLFFNLIIKDEPKSFNVKRYVLEKSKYMTLLEYTNSQLQENIKLILGENTFPCVLCHLEPPSAIKPELRISFEFDVMDKREFDKEDLLVSFTDQLFDNGIIKFRFLNKELGHLPKLKLN
jgi:hypothetical protein